MKNNGKRKIFLGIAFVMVFAIFTCMVQNFDVKPLGVNETNIGFSTLNCIIHKLCGVNMTLYVITDWCGLVPIFVVLAFGILGLVQLIKRKCLFTVDTDILILGLYYIIVAVHYIIFEIISINFRPILINGVMESSYPSSTTLLVLGIMPTLVDQFSRRCKMHTLKIAVNFLTVIFSVSIVVGRLFSGVHWFTDILGSVLISVGLFYIYKGSVILFDKNDYKEDTPWNLAKNFKT